MTKISAVVIFDNGGGTTLQLSNAETGERWAHYYDGPKPAAWDVRVALTYQRFDSFDGHEDNA